MEKRKQEEWIDPDVLIKQFQNQLNSTYTDDEGRDITERFYFLAVGNPVAVDIQFEINLFCPKTKNGEKKRSINIWIEIQKVFIEFTNDLIWNIATTALSLHRAT